MNYKTLSIIFISLMLLTVVSARVDIQRTGTSSRTDVHFYTGNLTNLSEMHDVHIPTPGDGKVLTWDAVTERWIASTINNDSLNNYIRYVNSTNFQVDTDTWVANFSSYYTKIETDVLNTSQTNYILENNNSVNNYILSVNNSITNTFVPYIGATTNVDLGNWNITTDWGRFNYLNISEDIHLFANSFLYFGDTDDSIFYQSLDNDFHFAGTGITYLTTTEGLFNFTGSNIDMFEGNVTANYFFGNGSQLTDITLTESDPMWTANWTSYYTKTETDVLNTSQTNYILENNNSVNNYILYVNSTNGGAGSSDSTWVANWTAFNTTWSSTTNTSYSPHEAGTEDGQLAYWDGDRWNHTETTGIVWLDTDNSLRIRNGEKSLKFVHTENLAHIKATDAGLYISSDNSTIKFQAKTYLWFQSYYDNHMFFDAGANIYFRDRDDSNAIKMMIESDTGYVGIGTTDPTSKLHVSGDANITGLIYGNGSQLTDITLTESDPMWTANWTAFNTTWSSTTNNSYSPHEDGTAQGELVFWNGSKWVHTETSEFNWDDVDKEIYVQGKITSDSWITANTNVYIKSPDTTKNFRFYQSDTSSNLYAENTPLVLKTSNGSLKIESDSYVWLQSDTSNPMYFDAGGSFNFRDRDDSNTVRASIDSATGGANFGLNGGNVGIGTDDPQNELNVIGDANITGLIYGNGSQLTDITLTESDPMWTANWTSYYTKTETDVLNTSQTNYINYQNTSINNYITENNNSVNNNINDKLVSTYHNATSAEAIDGTIDGGFLNYTQHPNGDYDGITLNFSEAAGSPGIDVRINFTSVEDFNNGIIRYKTGPLFGDYPIIQMWDYDDESWEDYPIVSESLSFATISQPVFDSSEHLEGEVAQMRIYKATNGNINNHYYIDWLAIVDGPGTPSGEEVDPHSVYMDGTRTLTANWDQGAFNLTNTDSWFFGIVPGVNVTGLDTIVNDSILENNQSIYNFILNVNSSMKNYVDDTFLTSYTETDPMWTANWTNVAFEDKTNVFTTNQNMSFNNVTEVDCILFKSGGKICDSS